MKLSKTHDCDQCPRKFETGVQLRNHKRIHAASTEPISAMENVEVTATNNVEEIRVPSVTNDVPAGMIFIKQYADNIPHFNSIFYYQILSILMPKEPSRRLATLNPAMKAMYTKKQQSKIMHLPPLSL